MSNKSAMKATGNRKENWQGMNWITQQKRLAIYLRDGLACAYCGEGVEAGAALSLDHLKPHSKGGSNHESNLVTCCSRCNSSRGNRALATFARSVAEYVDNGSTEKSIVSNVRKCSSRSPAKHKIEAKDLIARRGSVAKVLAKLA